MDLGSIDQLLEPLPPGEPRRATLSAYLKQSFPFISWVGFYGLNDSKDRLWILSYQGPLACTEILLPKGVCGVSCVSNKTIIVDEVDHFPGHIACDIKSQSELVIPVLEDSEIIQNPSIEEIKKIRSLPLEDSNPASMILDIDSYFKNAFSLEFANQLQTIFRKHAKSLL